MTPTLERALETCYRLLEDRRYIVAVELQNALGTSKETVWRRLKSLVEMGSIERRGLGVTTHYTLPGTPWDYDWPNCRRTRTASIWTPAKARGLPLCRLCEIVLYDGRPAAWTMPCGVRGCPHEARAA